MNKTQVVLYMYECLLEKGYFTKEQIQDKTNVPSLTFLRYIQELRAYLMNFNKNHNVCYSSQKKMYFLNDR